MQRIERYGVIALVFLLVTILAVAVWGQRKNQSLLSFLKRDKPDQVAKVDPATAGDPGLGLSTPSHEVQPAAPGALPGGAGVPTLDPTTLLAAPAGPGPDAVTFAPGSGVATTPEAPGFLGEGRAAVPPANVQPAPPASVPVAPRPGPRTYRVKRGDTLGSIAQRELGSTKRWKELAALNGVQPERLAVGMLIQLPGGAGASAPQPLVQPDAPKPTRPPVIAKAPAPRTYNVRKGDSLTKIAAAQLGDAGRYGEILLLNPGIDPATLSIGQTLRMPEDARSQVVESKPKPKPAPQAPQVARAETAPKKARVQ